MANLVRRSAGKIIQAKGSTAYGVAAAAARLVRAIVHDSRDVLTVSRKLDGAYSLGDFAMSTPCVIDRTGAHITATLSMTEEERACVEASAKLLQSTLQTIQSERSGLT